MRRWRLRHIAGAAIHNPLIVLAAVAALNAAVYVLVFVHPWSLLALYQHPLLDLHRLSTEDPLARWRLLAGFALLGLLYWLGWRAALRARGRMGWVLVLAGAAISGGILLFLYPFDAADVFDNIVHGRILGVYGANPFDQVAADFRSDPFLSYVGWRHFPSAYGPGWELVAAATAQQAGDGIVANVLAFKILGGLFLAGCVSIVAGLVRHTTPERALACTLLLAWNPLVLYETLGHGHNDIAMLFWILACVWWMARGRYTLAALALVTGALFKFVPLLLLPPAGLIALRALPGAKARLRFVTVTTCATVFLVILAYAPFWHGPQTLRIEQRFGLFTSSLPAVAFALLEAPLGEDRAALVVSLAAAVIAVLCAMWQGIRASRTPSWQAFAQAAFAVLMCYLLVSCSWFQQWYVLWPMGLVALLPPGRLVLLGVSFGFAVLSKPFIFEPLWLWAQPSLDRSWLELRLGPAVLAIPWLLTVVVLWAGWRTRSSGHRPVSRSESDR